MKKILRIPLLLVALFLTSIPLSAEDFYVDGIYYNIISSTDKTVAVTYSGSSYYAVDNEYTGSVVIPETVTYSGTTYSVTSIGSQAFRDCTSLTAVTIPNSVIDIGDGAFSYCTGLTSVTIPNSVTEIGSGAFSNCSGLTEVTIPNSVTLIGDHAFYYCSGLTSVTIPNSVTSIGEYAFYNCRGLTEVNITDLSAWCKINFNGADSNPLGYAHKLKLNSTVITDLIIPSDITEIKGFAFYGCTGFILLTIPNSVTSIGNSAFYGCTGLTSIKVECGNAIYDSRENCNAIIETASNTLVLGCKNTTIPNSVTTIGDDAFSFCTGLTSVTIPSSVTSIGNGTFRGCTGLTSIKVESGNSIYDSHENCNAIIETATNTLISGCKNTIIPSSVTSIGSYAFNGCTGLTSVTIPNSVDVIGDYVFNGCVGLKNVVIKDGSTTLSVGRYSNQSIATTAPGHNHGYRQTPSIFEDCPLEKIYVGRNTTSKGFPICFKQRRLKSVQFGENVTMIPAEFFLGCDSITCIDIPNSVTSIGSAAFYDCENLSSIYISNSIESIGCHVFSGCSNLANIYVRNPVPPVLNYSLDCYTATLYVPFGAVDAYSSADYWSNFTNIVEENPEINGLKYSKISDTEVKVIGMTESVNNIAIPSTITINNKTYTVIEITVGAFRNCTSLTFVTIPESVITIGNSAFSGCTSLTTVNFNATNCTTMGSYSYPVFSGCTAFTTLNIGDNVTNIPGFAFDGCTGLTSVTIPNSVTSIGNYAFWGCDKLINNSVTTTQTTATINLTSPTQYNLGLYYSDSDKKQAENGVVTITGLKPGYTNSNYDLALIINGIYCPIKDLSFTTKSFSASLSGSTTATSVSAIGTYTDGDVTILGEGINYGNSVTNYDGNNTITVNNLDPNRSYTIYYAVKTQEGGVYSTSKSFTTGALTWSNGGFTATSTTSARLNVETSCDATAGTGFEWKRYDAPESLAPSKAPCPVVEGMLVGSLRNLNPDVYYKCRPYYTSSSGNTYYGEWITFFTGDANVYFEPEVRTFSERSVVNNSVTVKGYALAGTDDISEQGFEYWKIGSITPSSTDTRMTVKASGISMTATLADLEYNTTYRYRAYVKTAQGTFYGAEEEFSTGEDPAGIEYIEVDDSDSFDVMLRENPATATAWVKVAGASATEAEYYIHTTNGGVVANGFIPADSEYQPIELNIANGLYLITVTDGTNIKTLRLIVR